jgi:hypothetical protein
MLYDSPFKNVGDAGYILGDAPLDELDNIEEMFLLDGPSLDKIDDRPPLYRGSDKRLLAVGDSTFSRPSASSKLVAVLIDTSTDKVFS